MPAYGPSISAIVSVSKDAPPKTTAAVNLPMKVLVDGRWLYFSGALSFTLSATQTIVAGELSMMGWWPDALGTFGPSCKSLTSCATLILPACCLESKDHLIAELLSSYCRATILAATAAQDSARMGHQACSPNSVPAGGPSLLRRTNQMYSTKSTESAFSCTRVGVG